MVREMDCRHRSLLLGCCVAGEEQGRSLWTAEAGGAMGLGAEQGRQWAEHPNVELETRTGGEAKIQTADS